MEIPGIHIHRMWRVRCGSGDATGRRGSCGAVVLCSSGKTGDLEKKMRKLIIIIPAWRCVDTDFHGVINMREIRKPLKKVITGALGIDAG